jgi:3-oxoadipate enol-lactonase
MRQAVGEIGLYYELHGDTGNDARPWLVFSHSLACNSAMWRPQLAEFAHDYRVLAFDTRGHGRSDVPAGPYTMEMLAEDAHCLLRELGIHNTHFAGLSMGGMIGQALTLRHPDSIASLTIADSTSRWPAEAISVFAQRSLMALQSGMAPLVDATLARWFTPEFRKSNIDEVARIGDMILHTPVAGYVGCSEAIPRINLTRRLREITCPILVIVGDRDPGTPVSMSQEIHKNAPRSELVIIEHAAHLSNVEQPVVFNQTLRRFLGRARATTERKPGTS